MMNSDNLTVPAMYVKFVWKIENELPEVKQFLSEIHNIQISDRGSDRSVSVSLPQLITPEGFVAIGDVAFGALKQVDVCCRSALSVKETILFISCYSDEVNASVNIPVKLLHQISIFDARISIETYSFPKSDI